MSKVEHLFSTCTQKAKYRISTQETLEKDQGIDRREKRLSCCIEEERGEFYRCLAPVFIALVEGTVKTLDLINWTGLKTTLPINQSSLAHRHAMDENPRRGAHLVFVQA